MAMIGARIAGQQGLRMAARSLPAAAPALRALAAAPRMAPRAVAAHAPAAVSAAVQPWRSFADAAASGAKAISIDVTSDGIAFVRLDCPGEKMNTLNESLNGEMIAALERIESDSSIRAAVLISAKPDNFVAGADIKMLDSAGSAEALEALSKGGQDIMNRIEGCKKPIVAAINGPCLGGGLELAAACHYRIATSSPKTKLGVPEVQLGLLPGAGGTQRLPKMVGIQAALGLMLKGNMLDAKRAHRMGLVQAVADPFALEHAALEAARGLADGSVKKAGGKKKNLMGKLLEDNPLGRMVIWDQAKKGVVKQAGNNYPAPFAILRCVQAGADGGMKKGLETEAKEFGQLGMTSVSQALRGIFFGQTACKKNPFGKPSQEVKTVGVLGAGLMGAGIAQVSAKAGYRVVLKDRDDAALARGEAQIEGNLAPMVKKRRMTGMARDRLMSAIVGATDDEAGVWKRHIGKCDVVIEAIFEDLAVKHQLVKTIEPLLPEHAVFATNTSALPIASIAEAAKRPERVVGMHYFSPVDKMPLLEVIPHAGTADEVSAAAVAVGLKQGKTIIVVKDVPGFYVNRCLGPFMVESSALLQEGVDPVALDKALKGFGFPVGPISLADEVGIDVANHVATFLADKLDNRMDGANPAAMQAMVDGGMLGRKSGKGFFTYSKGKGGGGRTINPEAAAILKQYTKAGAPGASMDAKTMADRMMARFMNEAIRCLQDDIIRSPSDGDVGAVFGIGFPPYLGGPFRYADNLGLQVLCDQMNRFADEVGPQFAPPQLLVDLAKAGKTFHSK